MTELLPNIFAIQVPLGLLSCKVYEGKTLIYSYGDTVHHSKQLPPGNYSFICASLTATEEEAVKIVEPGLGSGYADYEIEPELKYCDSFIKATDSLHSLLRSKGLNPELNYAILRKQL